MLVQAASRILKVTFPETSGCLAQLVEHRPYKARVVGSNPTAPTIFYGSKMIYVGSGSSVG